MIQIPSAPYVRKIRKIIRECPSYMSSGQWLSEEWGARVTYARTNDPNDINELLEFEDEEKAVLFILRFT